MRDYAMVGPAWDAVRSECEPFLGEIRQQVEPVLETRFGILVHTMGKVGSSAAIRALEESDVGVSTYHTHILNPSRFLARRLHLKRLGVDWTGIRHLRTSLGLMPLLRQKGLRWAVISDNRGTPSSETYRPSSRTFATTPTRPST